MKKKLIKKNLINFFNGFLPNKVWFASPPVELKSLPAEFKPFFTTSGIFVNQKSFLERTKRETIPITKCKEIEGIKIRTSTVPRRDSFASK